MGKKLGIALGGGSARGFAHLGVLKVLEEEGIKIDLIAGCSMGSLLGGIYASGFPLDKLIDIADSFKALKYVDLAAPFISEGDIHGNKIEKLIGDLTGDILIENAKIPFACLATCIEDGAARYFTSGKMYEAIRASISLPAIFVPVEIDGKTYVDGGMVDRSAISALELLKPDIMIASNVDYLGGPLPKPSTKKQVVSYSYDILSYMAVKDRYKRADVTITSDIPLDVGNDYSDKLIPEIIEDGAAAAKRALPEIKKLISE